MADAENQMIGEYYLSDGQIYTPDSYTSNATRCVMPVFATKNIAPQMPSSQVSTEITTAFTSKYGTLKKGTVVKIINWSYRDDKIKYYSMKDREIEILEDMPILVPSGAKIKFEGNNFILGDAFADELLLAFFILPSGTKIVDVYGGIVSTTSTEQLFRLNADTTINFCGTTKITHTGMAKKSNSDSVDLSKSANRPKVSTMIEGSIDVETNFKYCDFLGDYH